ncbi:MAG: hypothetical protein L3K15_03930 [Thermoplasmata archaeon]|nr:hypothetical protein [Thermoplasmata archaeon]
MASATTVTARCPACGGLLAATATAYATSYVRCPHCGEPVPIVAPRDPPPLFAWEVSPQLYPPIPTLSDGGRRPVRPFVLGALVVAAVIAAVVAGIVAEDAARALTPGRIVVAGTVEVGPGGVVGPLPFAHLRLTGENGYTASGTTAPDGSFSFSGVPRGAVAILVNSTGYPNTTFDMFFSPVYSEPAHPTGLVLELPTGSSASSVTVLYASFGSLEELAATLLTAVVIFAVGIVMAAVGVWAILRQRRPGLAVAGAAGVLAAPICLPLLTLDTVLPDVLLVGSVASAFAAAAFVLLVVPIALTASAPDE